MAYPPRTVVAMSHPDRWLAFLRIVVGLYFAKAVYTKLGIVMVGGLLPLPGASQRWIHTMPSIVSVERSRSRINACQPCEMSSFRNMVARDVFFLNHCEQ